MSSRLPRKIFRNSPLASARRYVAAGYAIIPLAPRGKVPLNKGGRNAPLKQLADLGVYANRHPDLNFGILTGAENSLVVIDVDGDDGVESLRELQRMHGDLPSTYSVSTTRGRHIYFDAPRAGLKCRVAWMPGIDIRADGGYVVGAGSVHETGARYLAQRNAEGDPDDIAPLPEWLDLLLRQDKKPKTSTAENTGQHVIEGHRNIALTQCAGQLRNAGLSPAAMKAALAAENAEFCHPPLGEDEVDKIAASVSRYPAHPATPDNAENVMELVLAESFEGGRHLRFGADGQFWRFDQTHWQAVPIQAIKQTILQTIQSIPTRKRGTSTALNQTLELMKARCADAANNLGFDREPPRIINCRNGEVWVSDDGSIDFQPHRPDSWLRHCTTADYDPTAKCPRYDQALFDIFDRSEDPDAMADFWDELMGFAMQPSRPRPLIVIGKGTGSNGKTGLMRLFVRLIGTDLVAAMPIQDLEKSRFSIGALDGKLLILDDDVKAGTRLPDGPLKRLSEQKTVTGEHKFGPQFQFTVRTVPILLCNGHPSIADLSYGMQRRLLVVPFDRRFLDEEADIDLFDRIAREEMSGVLNRYLDGLRRLMKRRWMFAKPPSIAKATSSFIEGANPLPSFLAEVCDRTDKILVMDLYMRFNDWCRENGVTYQKQRLAFRRDLENLGYRIEHLNRGQTVLGLSIRTRRPCH